MNFTNKYTSNLVQVNPDCRYPLPVIPKLFSARVQIPIPYLGFGPTTDLLRIAWAGHCCQML